MPISGGNSEISDRMKQITADQQAFTLDMMEHNKETSKTGQILDASVKELKILTEAPNKMTVPQ